MGVVGVFQQNVARCDHVSAICFRIGYANGHAIFVHYAFGAAIVYPPTWSAITHADPKPKNILFRARQICDARR